MARRPVRDAKDARRCLDAVAASGLAQAQWAHANGVDARSLNTWRRKLQRQTSGPTPTRLVELVPTERWAPEPARYVVRCGPLAVEVDERFDEQVLRRLLGVVASC